MKTFKFIVTAILVVVLGNTSFAQVHDHSNSSSSKTEVFKVSGNCDMCKATIEKAAKTAGVSNAVWNMKTQQISITYDSSKVKADDVLKKIASVGYDTQKFKADKQAYDKLPACCQYKRSL